MRKATDEIKMKISSTLMDARYEINYARNETFKIKDYNSHTIITFI